MTFIIGAFYFFYFSIVAVYIIFMPKVLQMTGYSPSQIGILFAAAPLVRFLVPFLFLKYIALTPRVFNAALVLTFVTSVLFYPFLELFIPLLITNILLGIGMSLSLPYVESISLSHLPKERYGKVRLFGSIGFILVSLVLVRYLDTSDNAILFLSLSAFFTLVFGAFLYRFEGRPSLPTSQEGKPFSLKEHWSLWLSLFLMQVAFGAFYNFFTIYASSYSIGIDALDISALDMTIYLWSFGVVCEVFMLYFQAPLLKKPLLKVLEFAIGITVVRWFIVAIFPDNLVLLFISQAIHAFSFALYHSATIMYLHTLYSDKKLPQQFFAGIAYGLGGFLGAFGSGFIYEISARGLYVVAALVTLLSFAFLWLEGRRQQA